MKTRMKNPMSVMPDALAPLLALGEAVKKSGLPPKLADMVNLRASQINGCSFCVAMHAHDLREAGESEERIATIAAWREAPWFDETERAVLALTEAGTRLSDRGDAVPDEVWDEAARHLDERALGGLVVAIGLINVYNRLNVITRQPAHHYKRGSPAIPPSPKTS